MEVHVLDRNVGMSAEQRESVDRSLQSAFDQFSSHIRLVDLSLSDVNGPKGGDDLQCRIKIVFERSGELVVEGVGSSVEAVVAETADRASSAVGKRLERQRETQGPSMSGE